MSMDRVHSLGDSWTCIEAGGANAGWQVYAGIKPQHRHGIPGSTAAQWAADEGGILTRAMATMKPGDTVFVSLVGNDFRHALADGSLSAPEFIRAVSSLRAVIDRLVGSGLHVIVMGYANPWPGNRVASSVAFILCGLIYQIANAAGAKYFDMARILVMPDHFDGVDIHKTAAGHKAVAAAVRMEVEG